MKRFFVIMISLVAMLTVRFSANAQEVTIDLFPGWTYVAYPYPTTVDLDTFLSSITPMNGDKIAAQFGYSTYVNGRWRGSVAILNPGEGYKYFSNNTEIVTLVLDNPIVPEETITVTTGEPTNITAESATIGGEVTLLTDSHVFMRGVCWGTTSAPDIDDSYFLDGAGEGSFTVTLDELIPNTTYYVRTYAVSDHGLAYGNTLSFTTESGGSGGDHAYVDLGLPSGLLWATCNVGADNPEDYGDYFAWGETQPKDTYSWSNYQYCMGSSTTLTKYCNNSSYGYNGFTDNLTTLLPEDDAATANWGNDWRMPTKEEFQELYNNTTVTWTTQNGVNGRLFTASNGNSLFLPAAGYRGSSSLDYAGSYGYYWSSSLYTGSPLNAWALDFSSDDCNMYYGSRDYGHSVRPVRVGSFVITATGSPSEGGAVSGGGTYAEGAECTLTATPSEDWSFVNWTESGNVVSTNATYTFTVNADRSLVANFTYNGGGDDHAYVDLGLPSGLLWATCNVGADNPEDYGDYFAWGETQPKDTYSWSTYQYCNGSYNTLTKYCDNSSYGYNGFTDNLTTLLPEDDAATANWGSDWRMPTQAEWQELLDNTTVTWTTQNGVNGRLFTASNGNSLFLPPAGYRFDSSLNGAGRYGYYWSSSLDTGYPCNAWRLFFSSGGYGMSDIGIRYYGHSVRPVRSSGQN